VLVDWFTIGAQALNFLILVWLLKRFLYRPILDAIDVREQRIAAELADADAKRAEAQRERDEFRHKNAQFDQQRAARMTTAMEEVKVERQRLMEEARNAADALSARLRETLRSQAQDLNQTIARQAQQEVFAIARMALKDLAAASLDERMGEIFIARLRALDGETKERFGKAIRTTTEPALVRSAFSLPPAQRVGIQRELKQIFSDQIDVRFVVAPDLVGGIELITNGQKIAWTIADYLTSLQDQVDALLAKSGEIEPQPTVEPAPNSRAKSVAMTSSSAEPSVTNRKRK
jgi:F-type H+-transporting ATPase subunit b